MDILNQLNLEEKAQLLSGNGWWQTHAIPKLNIPAMYLTDGPHGLRKADVAGLGKSVQATCFPTASALASSWNKKLLYEVGEALGKECQTHNVQVLLGPGINMKRSPMGGRNFEYFSEDPVLTGQLASQLVQGVQSQGIGTSLKHFAVNNQEHERMASDSVVDERTLHEIYLRAFEIVVREAKPWSVMCSYNLINGVCASENKYLLKDILRERWGFTGFVVSDWGAVNDRIKGVQAGLDLEMPGSGEYNRQKIIQAVKGGHLSEKDLNSSVAALLEIILKTNQLKKKNFSHDPVVHHQLARRVAGECIVLLKNERQLLPIQSLKTKKIYLTGPFAREPRFQGVGSSQVNPSRISNVHDELVALLPSHVKVNYSDKLNHESKNLAATADLAIVCVGLTESAESEGFDRNTLAMPTDHNQWVIEIAKVQRNTVVILFNGSAVTMPWLPEVPVVIESWLTGQAGGGALADILLGVVNPSGKLSETFPQSHADTPTAHEFPGMNKQVLYHEGLFIGYRHYDQKNMAPLFPFGFGLSYTQFAFKDIRISHAKLAQDQDIELDVLIKNIGLLAGAEVIQVYVHEKTPSHLRPVHELKTFEKVYLQPNEEKWVPLRVSYLDFAYYDVQGKDWQVNSGVFELHVGSSSRDLPLSISVDVQGNKKQITLTKHSLLKEFKKHPQGSKYYLQLLKAVGIDLDEKNPNEMLVAFLDDMPVLKIPAFSEGKLTDEALSHLLVETNSIT